MRIIAFDPGTLTGVASGRVVDDTLVVEQHSWDNWLECAFRFRRSMENAELRADAVVYESWRLTGRGARTLIGSAMPWCQFIGMMRMICIDHGIEPWVQEPGEKYVIDARMGGTDYLPKSAVEHNRDALRHMIKYAVEQHSVKVVDYGARKVDVYT